MYGSDAIGGVIDVKENHMAAENTINGSVDLLAKSNNNLMGTSVSISGRKKSMFADLRATVLDYGDYKVPTDSVNIYSFRAPLYNNQLRNTAGKEMNLHLSFGYVKENFQSRFYLSDVNSKSGFFANTHGLEPRNVDMSLHDKSSRDILYPYQQVNHLKIINKSQWQWNKFKLETALGYQQNFRQEWSQYVNHGYMPAIFPEYLDFDGDLERQFDKQTYSGNLKLSYNPNDKTLFIIGLNGEHQHNQIDGRGFIIPAFKGQNEGAYLFSRHKFSKQSMIQMAVRYDNGHINTQQYKDWFPSPLINGTDTSYQYLERAADLDLDFSNISWSIGYNFKPGKWSYKANIGKSFRMPIAKELKANGVNYHRFSYEVGNPDLSPEIAYQFDAGLEYNSRKFAVGTTPFLNYFSNYIYLNPGYEHDRLYGNGNQVYYYTESEVLRYGGELHAHYQVKKTLQLGIIGEYVYSRQLSGLKKGYTLPFSPPASAIFNVKYTQLKLKSVHHVYLSLDYRISSAQNNVVPPEKTTEAYQLINFGLGGEIYLKGQKLSISMQVKNLLNKKYFNHTSYYRLINVPESGRNFIVNISIPISFIKNKHTN
jgi:iron complex outermembrane receptor protein